MYKNFDIFCNNCGSQVVFQSAQRYTTCSACGTYLKLEETERTFAVVIVEKQEFLKAQQQPAPIEKDYSVQQQALLELEKDWDEQREGFMVKSNKKMILPRKTRSLIFLIISACSFLGGILFDGEIFIWLGVGWAVSSGEEYSKAIKYEKAKRIYEAQKEKLQLEMNLLR